jgi:hypothetical protein
MASLLKKREDLTAKILEAGAITDEYHKNALETRYEWLDNRIKTICLKDDPFAEEWLKDQEERRLATLFLVQRQGEESFTEFKQCVQKESETNHEPHNHN